MGFLDGYGEDTWMLVWPVVIYWTTAAFYDLLDHAQIPAVERFRLHSAESVQKCNVVPKRTVIYQVIVQHTLQTALGIGFNILDPNTCAGRDSEGWADIVVDFIKGMFVMDLWQYVIHRGMHEVRYLYKHIHSHHHRLVVPYAYGALYNHPLEGLLLDSLGGLVALLCSGMSCRTAKYLFTVGTLKTVLDHCGYRFPINPLHGVFPNNSMYHDVHHRPEGIKKNFSQPFFTIWDIMFGSFQLPGKQFDQAVKSKQL